jgi:hypothetical protein
MFSELLIFDTALSIAEQADIEEYLFTHWATPEPGVAMLLGICGLTLLRRKRKA